MVYKFKKLVILTFLPPAAIASTKSTTSFTLDNDAIFGVDHDYSSGIFFSYASGQLREKDEWETLSLRDSIAPSLDKVELVIGHKMWTPSDIEANYPLPNDRPYAGYLHTEMNYISLTSDKAVRYNFTIGLTGENSFAGRAQSVVHSIIDSPNPKGWEYQIDEYLTFSFGYRAFNKLMRNEEPHRQWEITNVSEINAGNFRSVLSQGVMFRWGTNLGNSIGAANISVESPFSASMLASNTVNNWFVFSGLEGRYRFNDITIEGERSGIPGSSAAYDVTLQHWQSSAVAGAVWYNQHYGASITFTVKTPEYRESQTSTYGTGSFSLFAFF